MLLADKYFTLSQLANHMGVTRQTISRWLKQGRIKGEKVGKEILFEKSSIPFKQCPTCKHWHWD